MTHEPEQDFDKSVEEFLEDVFPRAVIENKPRLNSGRIPDFVVTWTTAEILPDVVMTVEVENDFESLTDGIGQSLLYAGHFEWSIPVVVVPYGHTEQPEMSYIEKNSGVLILEVPS